jgi:hypothetical protein
VPTAAEPRAPADGAGLVEVGVGVGVGAGVEEAGCVVGAALEEALVLGAALDDVLIGAGLAEAVLLGAVMPVPPSTATARKADSVYVAGELPALR